MFDDDRRLRSLDDVSALMRNSLPEGMTIEVFGKRIGWGRRSEEAKLRIMTITRSEVEQIGLQLEQARNWVSAYEAIARLTPKNPSAEGRIELMRQVVKLLQGDESCP